MRAPEPVSLESPSSRTRVLHVTEATEAGVANFVAAIARLDSTASVMLLGWRTPTANLEATLREAGVAVYTFPLASAWKRFTEIRNLFRTHEVVVLHSGVAGILGRLGIASRLLPASSPVYAPHMSVGYVHPALGLIEQALSRFVRPQHFLFVSESERAAFANSFRNGRRNSATVVYPWVGGVVKAIDRDRPAPGRLRLVTIGRISKQKAPLRIAALLNALHAADFPADFCWVGDGPLREAFLDALSAGAASRLQVTGWVRNVPETVAEWRPHFYVNLSLREGFSIAAVEAMSMGLPAIASNVMGNDELVSEWSNGIFASVDPRETVAKVRTAISPGVYEALCAGALQTAGKFDANLFEASYRRLVASATRNSRRKVGTAVNANYAG